MKAVIDTASFWATYGDVLVVAANSLFVDQRIEHCRKVLSGV